MEKKRPKAPLLCHVILFAALLALFIPAVYLVISSFWESSADSTLTLKWYSQVFSDQTLQEALLRSLGLAAASALATVILSTGAAVALQSERFAFSPLLNSLSLASLVLPELVFALSLLAWFFVVQFELSLVTVFFSHITFGLPFSMMVIRTRLKTLDPLVSEAAQDLGARDLQIFRKVTLPQILPALVSAYILVFLLSFDDFLITFFTNGVGSDTLPIRLYTSMKMGLSPKLNALSALMLLVTSILVFILARSSAVREMISSQNEK